MDKPWALITGATSGIGLEFARHLAAKGCNVLMHGRRKEVLEAEAAKLVSKHAVEVQLIIGDLANAEVLQAILKAADGKRVGWLINNAGFGADAGILDDSVSNIELMLRLHCEIPVLLCRHLVPRMREQGSGRVINVGSLAGSIHLPGRSALYSASKDFLRSYTESLFHEGRAAGLRVMVLMPGFVRTDFHSRLQFFPRKQTNKGLLRWMDSPKVAANSLRRIEARSYSKPHFVPGIANKILYFLSGLLPWWLKNVAARRELVVETRSRQS